MTRIKGVGRGSARAAARDDPKARAARVLEFSPSLLAVHVAAREYRQDAYATLLAPGSYVATLAKAFGPHPKIECEDEFQDDYGKSGGAGLGLHPGRGMAENLHRLV